MKKLSLKEVKHRIRNHEALPDDVVRWYPKLMSRYTIRKAKRNPDGFTGKESRPRLKRYRKGEYRRSARSKELYPRAFVKNPGPIETPGQVLDQIAKAEKQPQHVKLPDGKQYFMDSGTARLILQSEPILTRTERGKEKFYRMLMTSSGLMKLSSFLWQRASFSNPSRISRIKSHVKAHLDKDQRDFQKEIDEDDELKMWLDRNPKFSASQRRKYAASGVALPDGSFPIRNRKDLMDALHDLGRTKHYAAAKRHIIKRARALELTEDLNPEWVRRKGKKRNPKRYHRMRNGDLVLAQ